MADMPDEPEAFEPFTVLERTPIYDSPWCTLRRDRVLVPSGAALESKP